MCQQIDIELENHWKHSKKVSEKKKIVFKSFADVCSYGSDLASDQMKATTHWLFD